MGEWFRAFFNGLGYDVLISDVDTKLTNVELAKKADIVIVSVPIKETVKVIKEVRGFVRKDGLLCDITSLKSKPVQEMAKARSGALGMHPLFGHLTQSLEGQKIVFCIIRTNKWVDFLRDVFTKNKAGIIEISPKDHDFQMAMVQALTHFTNINLARTFYVQKFTPDPSFLTPVFRLQSLIIGRVLGQDPKLYADIEIENPYFKKVLACFEKQIKDLAEDVKNKRTSEFVKKFIRSSLFLEDFIKVAQSKSTQALRLVDQQPIKIKKPTQLPSLKQEGIRVGFLGPEGTFSHQAALKIFPQTNQLTSFNAVRDIFEAVNNQEVDFGVVPAENTLAGVVPEAIDSLIEYPLKVTGAFEFEIHHCLLGKAKNKKDLKVIKSHKQALSQCRDWLQSNLPNVRLEPATSTTSAIKETKSLSVGFIASQAAAVAYGLNVLARNIEDTKDNVTKFYLISSGIVPEIQQKLGKEKTLLLLAVYNRPGILRDILNPFADNKLDLSSLHSVPSRLQPWDYFFFLEVRAPYNSGKLAKVLKEIEKYCTVIRKLGVS